MKKNIPYLPIAAIILFCGALLYLAHRERNKQEIMLRVNPAFREYVQAFTSGNISTQSTIKVRLAEDFADSSSIGKTIEASLFRFKPEIKGQATWIDCRTIAFNPDQPLPHDRLYLVEFAISKLISIPDSLNTLKFQFRTMKQVIEVKVDNHTAYSHSDLSREYVAGTLFTSDETDLQQVETVLTATQDGQSLPISWTHDRKKNEHLFRVDSVRRGKSSGTVKIAWDGSPIDSESAGDMNVEIPALGDFMALSAQNLSIEQSCIAVQFSEVSFTLEPSIRNINQKELGKRITGDVTISDKRPNVRFVGDGVIMPTSNGMLLPFEAVNLSAVNIRVVRIFEKNILQFLQVNDLPGNSELARVGRIALNKTIPLNGVADRGNWNRYSIDLSTLMKAEPGAIYSIILSFKQAYSTYPCSGSDTVLKYDPGMVAMGNPEQENEQDWGWYSNYYDDDYRDGGWRNFHCEEREDPCKASYFFNKTISRNVLASDLGMVAKSGSDGAWHIFITDIVTAKPLAGVSIEFFNFQLQPIARGETNGEGIAVIPVKHAPFVVVARYGAQSGYLKLADGKSLSLSMFDVSGEPVQKGLKGFIYGERGVWRPGDSIFLSFILEDKTNKLPKNHPVSLSLFNPSGQMINRIVRSSSVNGFYNFKTATSWDAPTGNWQAKVTVGNAEFRKTLKIETVKPNRLKILFDFKTDRLIRDKIPPAVLQASWLTGATARNLKANVTLTLTKSVTAFTNYPGYVFDNPTVGFAPENITIFDGRLDENGATMIQPKIHVTNIAPGALKASFETTVFEDGGDFSIDRFTIPYYPYSSYAGLKVPQATGGDRVLYTDKQYSIDLLNIDAQGNPVSSGAMKVEVYKLEWRWWWDDSEKGSADFISIAYNRPVDSASVRTINGRATYTFQTEHDAWGRYLIKVTDRASGHAAGKVVYVDWPGYFRMPGGEKQAAAMLTLTTDKPKYKVGEKVKLTLPTSPDGRALVTIETGTSVIKSFWVPTTKGSTDIAFDATEAMAPNCYAYVTLIQPHAQTKNDLPIRLYGVIAIPVENPGTHLKPVISMSSEFSPGKETSIAVKEADGKAMTYTLAVVDEGLLDLTRFKTPDPWIVFYAREALGVKTWDLFDDVMGAFSGDLQRILSIGGDQEELAKGGLKANRFKAMVKFFGPFELKKGQSRTQTFIMPEYIGSVRVMVVAGQDGAYGCAEKSAPVKKPLMVLGTLPRVLGPGESVRMSVSVFAMDKKIRNVKVEVIPDEFFTVSGTNAKQLTFTSPGDQMAVFDMKVAEKTGIARIKIVATSGNERAENTIEIGVRNPNLPVTNVQEKAIQPGGSWNAIIQAPGIAGTNRGTIELSSIPAMNLDQRLYELIRYPYGCIEQTVSAVFPQLYLSTVVALSDNEKRETERNISAAIGRLRSFQLSNGGFGYWQGASYADDWGTCYAGHFLLEAEKKGFTLPMGWLSQWKEFQRQKAVSWNYNANYYNDELIQAYRLYTLALAKVPELGAMNKLLEKRELSLAARWRLAAAYQVAGKREVALQLINTASTAVKPYREMGDSYGSDLRDKAMIVETLTLLDLRTKAAPLVKEIAAAMCSSGWYSTQTTAYCLLAITQFVGNSAGSGVNATLRADGSSPEEIVSSKPVITRQVDVNPGKKGTIQVANKGKGILFARLILTGIPARGDSAASSNNLKISVVYKTMQGAVISPILMEQGTSFLAEVTVTNPGMFGKYKQLALSQVFPSGWEIINARSSDLALSKSDVSAFDYQDVRDDRVITFFDLDASQSKTITVALMAAWQGKFYLPPTGCSAMYDNTISARVPGRWVEVVPARK
ncbi:MAG: MG2 domain-containing protein [Bacteroidetes bacterium]|nr:MG2 domain-containing protein [Bacteroidota bacterium]